MTRSAKNAQLAFCFYAAERFRALTWARLYTLQPTDITLGIRTSRSVFVSEQVQKQTAMSILHEIDLHGC